MKEKHFAYKIISKASGVVWNHIEIEEDKMLDLLNDIQQANSEGIYWIFKQLDNQPKEPLCIIDCEHKRIYYHYSGEVEDISTMIQKLSKWSDLGISYDCDIGVLRGLIEQENPEKKIELYETKLGSIDTQINTFEQQ